MTERSFYDIHSHILPSMDDGAKDIDTSLEMLAEAKRQGCRGIIATPHYYRKEPIGSFLQRRERSFQTLVDALEEADPFWIDRIALGAEVAYHSSLMQDRQLDCLLLGSSDYLLLEMPFHRWTQPLLRDINRLIGGRGYKIVIAHLERYDDYAESDLIDQLLQMSVLVQMDTEELLSGWSRRRNAVQMIRSGLIDTLGSDCHNMTSRPPNMGPAIEQILRGRAASKLDRMLYNNRFVFLKAIGQ